MTTSWQPSDAETQLGDDASVSGRRHAARQIERGDAIGRYLVLGRLGAGGMGVVYSAYDPELDRRIAIKLLRFEPDDGGEGGRHRLLREAQAMARITHPNVVTVHDVGTDGGRVYVAMEYIDGQTLRAWLAAERRTWREVIAVFTRAGRGLQAAHDGRLVHRDFKPDNVMVATDGRVVVMDFGLALGERTSVADDPHGSSSGPGVAGTQVSGAARVTGTLAYMSPEQLGGAAADPRSDQFSFCVALYQALYGSHPFAEHAADLVFAISTAALREPPPGHAVPGFVRRALERGLRREPADRWPSMAALLAALDDGAAGARRRRWGYASALLGVGALGVGTWWSLRGDAPCSGAAARLVGVWDEARHQEVAAVIAALDAPWAQTTADAVLQRLDGYAGEWIGMHTEACRATTVYGAQSEALMDLRIGCLERARMDLQATADQLATADPEVLARAHRLAAELPALDVCADVEQLVSEAPAPADPEAAAEVEALRVSLAGARAANRAGRYAAAEARLVELQARVDAVDYASLVAEHRLALGQALRGLARMTEAQASAEHSLRLGLATGQPELAAHAAQLLVDVLANQQRRPAEALIYANVALGLAERRGQRRALAEAHGALALAHMVAGDHHEAEQRTRHSLELDPGDDAVFTARQRHNLAADLGGLGRHDEALAELRAAAELLEGALGPEHPDLLTMHQSMGNALLRLQRYDEAGAEFRRALAIGTAALAADHPDVVGVRLGLASELALAGRLIDAEAELRAVLAAVERSMGPEHPRAALVHGNLATILFELHRSEDAESHSRRALAIYAATLGADHLETAVATGMLGRALAAQGRHDEALEYYSRAATLRERAHGSEHPVVARELLRWSSSLNELGRHGEAAPLLERALAIYERQDDPTAEDLAHTRFELARALASSDRARARSLAEQALPHVPEQTRAQVQAWLAAHP